VAADIVHPLKRTASGNQYSLIMVDKGNRLLEAIPLRKMDAASTADAMLRVFSAYGTPNTIVSDNGGSFTSSLLTTVLKSLNISHIRVSPYHPKANGMVE